jgi:hypothetical protein
MEPKFEPTTQLDADGLNDVLAAAVEGREPTAEMCKVYIGVDGSGIAMLAKEFAEKGTLTVQQQIAEQLEAGEGADGAPQQLNLDIAFATTSVTAFQLGVLYERERLTRQLAAAHEDELPES